MQVPIPATANSNTNAKRDNGRAGHCLHLTVLMVWRGWFMQLPAACARSSTGSHLLSLACVHFSLRYGVHVGERDSRTGLDRGVTALLAAASDDVAAGVAEANGPSLVSVSPLADQTERHLRGCR